MANALPLSTDPVLEALRAPIVQTMAPDRRAQLEADLRAMAARGAPEAMLREAIAIRLRQEALADDLEPLTAEELAELEQEADEADEDLRAGRCIPLEEVLTRLSPRPPTRA